MSRAGRFIPQPGGFRAFHPATLPPSPPLALDEGLLKALSQADQHLARLDGIASTLPDPDLFVSMYVRQEAVLSSQIEGTQSTLEDVLQFELDPSGHEHPKDVTEVVNYVAALNHGLARLADIPLSLRLTKEVHERLLQGVRGSDRTPGEFRRIQNWIGPAGCLPATAIFVPPPVPVMHTALGEFEAFLHDERLPVLIHCGLAHAQFETIHPFEDGNGRVGRLLIALLLANRGVLARPLLYLSRYLKRHRTEYYDRLTAIRESGDWEGWLRFFLKGVAEVSRGAGETGRRILHLRETHRGMLTSRTGVNVPFSLRLLEDLFRRPLTTIAATASMLGCSTNTAGKLLNHFRDLGLMVETTGFERNRRFAYQPYLDLFAEPDPPPETPGPME